KGWSKSEDLLRCRPYSVLLPVGFAVPFPLPETRGALTAPFHPCRANTQRTAAVCSLWHCPWGCPRRMLSGTVCPGARTFLPGHLSVLAGAAVRPTDPIGMGRGEVHVKSVRRRTTGPWAGPISPRQLQASSPAGNRGRS